MKEKQERAPDLDKYLEGKKHRYVTYEKGVLISENLIQIRFMGRVLLYNYIKASKGMTNCAHDLRFFWTREG